jgi:rare lipoprotein A
MALVILVGLLRRLVVSAAVSFATPCAMAAVPGTTTAPLTSPQMQAQARQLAQQPALPAPHGRHPAVDVSGRKQVGDASVYSLHFQGHRMADGRRFDQRGNAAASKTLPIGTVAKVTNLENGRTAVVKVQDHGPYVDGRTVDVSRSTARQLGISRHEGVAPVVVAPVTVPQANGAITIGAGAVPGPAASDAGKQ